MVSSSIGTINFSGLNLGNINAYNSVLNNKIDKVERNENKVIEYNHDLNYDEDTNLLEEFKTNFNIFNSQKLGDVKTTFKSNAIFYTITAIFDNNNLSTWTESVKTDGGILSLVMVFAALGKTGAAIASGKSSPYAPIEGFLKPGIKYAVDNSSFKSRVSTVFSNVISRRFNHIPKVALDYLSGAKAKIGHVYSTKTLSKSPLLAKFVEKHITGGDPFTRDVFKLHIYNNLSNMAIGTGVDFAASIGVNLVLGIFDGDALTRDELKLGSTLLKSSWKTICATAFETCCTFAGPTGRKIGKTVGTVVGATIGSFVEKAFDGNEWWCGVAGVATITGAAVAGTLTTILIASSVIAVSVPVAGWIVGGAIIAGAAIGTVVTWLVMKVWPW